MITEINESELNNLLELYTERGDNPIPEIDDSIKDKWKSICNDENYHIVVAKENNKIVSTCTVIIIPNLTHNQRPYAFIENVVTSKDYRKKGYETAVLNYAKDIAKILHGHREIKISTTLVKFVSGYMKLLYLSVGGEIFSKNNT